MKKTRNIPIYWGKIGDNLSHGVIAGTSLGNLKLSKPAILEAYRKAQSIRNLASVYLYQDIGYEVFDSTNYARPRFNRCAHSKLCFTSLPYLIWNLAYNSSSVSYRHDYERYQALRLTSALDMSPRAFDNLEDVQSRAWWNLQPRFEGELSLLNEIYELKDFKDILKHAVKFDYKNLATNFRKALKKGVPNVGYFDPTKPIASLYLTNEYAIKPMIKSIMTIHKQLFDVVQEKQLQFQALGEKVQKSHYRETLDNVSSLTPGTKNYFYLGSGSHKHTLFNATLEYTYKYEMRELMLAFMKYWGLTASFEAWWNAVPFSFVADYFISIGDSLHAMEKDKNVTLTESQYCESLTTTVSSGTHLVPHPKVLACVIDDVYIDGGLKFPRLIAGYEGTIFNRLPKAPYKGMALPRLHLPSYKQNLNLLALGRCFL